MINAQAARLERDGRADHVRAMVILRPSLPRKLLGWSFLTLGVLGLVLPFLQGALFIAFGLFVLRDQHIWAAQRWDWVVRRWPHHVGSVEAFERRLRDRFAAGWRSVKRIVGRG